MKKPSAQELIDKFQMERHIEGGYFKEDFKSEIVLPKEIAKKEGSRSIITTCYYLIPRGERSILHKLTSDEIWNYMLGGSATGYQIQGDGKLSVVKFGPNIGAGQQLKHLVKAESWFGVLPDDETDYVFFSAVVFPGFEYQDWEKGDKHFLKSLCPSASKIIDLLT